jgi:PAS domain-containing protein
MSMSAQTSTRELETLRGLVDATRLLGDSDVIGVVFWDGRGRITEANDAFLRLLGYTRAELRAGALDWRELTPEEYRAGGWPKSRPRANASRSKRNTSPRPANACRC